MIEIPPFDSRNKRLAWLVENKTSLMNQKKATIKEADAYSYWLTPKTDREVAAKAASTIGDDPTKLFVRAVINTTKLMDSHDDVHINGLWKKSVAETKENYLIAEHQFNFKGIITDEVTVSTKILQWKTLGFDFPGTTEALIYDAILTKERNEYMFEQYAKMRVKNHSVGMRYVKLFLCVNSPAWEEEKENWDKYIGDVVNSDAAEEQGYFWAVTEAKNVEGSAVVKGSNWVTPTLITREEKDEPPVGTQKREPGKSTQMLNALSELNKKLKT